MAAAVQVETLLQSTIAEELDKFRHVSAILLALSLIFSAFVAYKLYRMENQRQMHLSTIERAHAEIQDQHNELKFLAHFDTLTELPNRTLFLDRLAQSLVHAQRNNGHVVLLFIDLDKFKAVNDRLGHPAGDQVLAYTANRLRKLVRVDDTVARLAGDEFTIILSDIDSEKQAMEAAKSVTKKIQRELDEPFGLNGNSAFVSASIGIAVYLEDGQTADELLSNADRAMFEVKSQGKNDFHFYSRELNERAKQLLRIENELREALDEDQLTVYYQPQWNIQDGTLAGMEALVRWQHPRDGLLQPGTFIPVAETSGLIEKIDVWVLEKACQAYQSWKAAGFKPGKLSVNLSPMTFRQADIIRIISGIVAENSIEEGELELELTESALLENTEHTQKLLNGLKIQSIRLAIDDFGTGYSSIAYLRDIPADTLKVDRSFIRVIHEDNAADAILKSIVEMAKSLGMKVVAEGIENERQETYVRSLGCHFAQGYRLARPMPAEEYRQLMVSHSESNVCMFIPTNNKQR